MGFIDSLTSGKTGGFKMGAAQAALLVVAFLVHS